MRRRFGCLVLAVCLTLGGAMTAEAAETKIEKVKVEFACDPEPEAGKEPGKVTATASSAEFTVGETLFTNEDEVWVLGDKPVVKVELFAKDGYRFSYTSKSRFSVSGAGAEFKKAKVYDGGDSLVLEVYLKQITGKPEPVVGVEWDGTRARWDGMEGAKGYEVKLYRNGSTAATVETTSESYNFASRFTKKGDYTFRVRALARYNGKPGEWSDYSEEYYVSQREADRNESSGSQYDGEGWVRDSGGWWYRYRGGGYPANSWYQVNNIWYYFNQNGYMLTGWQQINGRWYYMDGSGAMLTNWQYINGRWYYLDGSGAMLTNRQYINGRWYYLDGSGAMLTGWQQINGRWYYMDGSGAMLTGWQYINGRWYCLDASGAMYADTWTPDGYYVDGSGAYTGAGR